MGATLEFPIDIPVPASLANVTDSVEYTATTWTTAYLLTED